MYREGRSPLAHVLETKLSPHGFKTVEPNGELSQRGVRKLFHRKTWNTNRGVVLAEPGNVNLADFVARMRHDVGPFLGSSWWSQLGLQLVLVMTESAPVPPLHAIEACVDDLNTHGILIQSVFAVDPSTGKWSQGRTWGQFVTGKFQDAIAAAIQEFVG